MFSKRSMEYGVWSVGYGVWSMEYGVWSMEYGVWSMRIVAAIKDIWGPSSPGSHGSWIYSYLCNQCLSSLILWVRISIRARCTTLCDKFCQRQVGSFLWVLRFFFFFHLVDRIPLGTWIVHLSSFGLQKTLSGVCGVKQQFEYYLHINCDHSSIKLTSTI